VHADGALVVGMNTATVGGAARGNSGARGGEGKRSRSWHSRSSFWTTPIAPLRHPGQRPPESHLLQARPAPSGQRPTARRARTFSTATPAGGPPPRPPRPAALAPPCQRAHHCKRPEAGRTGSGEFTVAASRPIPWSRGGTRELATSRCRPPPPEPELRLHNVAHSSRQLQSVDSIRKVYFL